MELIEILGTIVALAIVYVLGSGIERRGIKKLFCEALDLERILRATASQLREVMNELPKRSKKSIAVRERISCVADLLDELADLVASIRDALRDGKITFEEAVEILKEIRDAWEKVESVEDAFEIKNFIEGKVYDVKVKMIFR